MTSTKQLLSQSMTSVGKISAAKWLFRAMKKVEQIKNWNLLNFERYKSLNLCIRGFYKHIVKAVLRDIFSRFGMIESCKIMLDENGNSKMYVFLFSKPPNQYLSASKSHFHWIMTGRYSTLQMPLHSINAWFHPHACMHASSWWHDRRLWDASANANVHATED